MKRAIALAAAVWLASLHPAAGETLLRADDAARLQGFTTSAGDALLQALAGGTPDDVNALKTALSGAPAVAFDESLQGDWSCRTMKLGGVSPLIVYRPFKCRFTLQLDGFGFEKLSGSQRTKGQISLIDGRAVYVGIGYVAGETPPTYADLPADFRSDGRIQTHVALFERISATRARLMFPSPAVESDFDILELTR